VTYPRPTQALKGWVQGLFVGIVLILLANKVVYDRIVVLTLQQWVDTLPFLFPRALLLAALPVTVACVLVAFLPALSRTQTRRLGAAVVLAILAAGVALLIDPPRVVVTVVHFTPGAAAAGTLPAPTVRAWPEFGPAYLPAVDAAIAALFGMLLAVPPSLRRA
jgi:hypothetical protein